MDFLIRLLYLLEHRHGDRPRSPTADHDDNPLPTAGIATAPFPLPPTMTTTATVASDAALPPLPLRPPLHWHFLMHTGEGASYSRASTCSARSRRLPAHASPRAAAGTSAAARSTCVPPRVPLGAADYQRTHRHAPPPALAQQLAHAHAPAAFPLCTGRTAARARTRARSLCLLCTGQESLRMHRNTHCS